MCSDKVTDEGCGRVKRVLTASLSVTAESTHRLAELVSNSTSKDFGGCANVDVSIVGSLGNIMIDGRTKYSKLAIYCSLQKVVYSA